MRKAMSFFSLMMTFAVSAALAADDTAKMSGPEIISKYIAAVGGKETLAKFKSRVAIGTAKKDSDAAIPVAIMSESPNRVAAIYQFEGYNWYLTYDGNKASIRPVLTRAAAPIMHKYEEMLATGTMFNDISLYNVISQGGPNQLQFEAKGMKKVKGRQAYVVDMKPDKGQPVRLYFDAENFMWLRSDYGSVHITKDLTGFTNNVQSNDQETTFDFYIETSDFKEVDGVKLPFKFEIVATAPILKQKSVGTIVTTIKEYRHNIPIDSKMFQ